MQRSRLSIEISDDFEVERAAVAAAAAAAAVEIRWKGTWRECEPWQRRVLLLLRYPHRYPHRCLRGGEGCCLLYRRYCLYLCLEDVLLLEG